MRGSPVVLGRMDRKAHSQRCAVDVSGPTLTQRQFAEGADINVIMRRFGVTGVLPQGLGRGAYGDFTGVSDIHDAFEIVERADRRFRALDPAIRARFRNDPRELARVARSMSEEEFYASFGGASGGALPAAAGVPVPASAGSVVVPPVAGAGAP